jgi:hypothetical protein
MRLRNGQHTLSAEQVAAASPGVASAAAGGPVSAPNPGSPTKLASASSSGSSASKSLPASPPDPRLPASRGDLPLLAPSPSLDVAAASSPSPARDSPLSPRPQADMAARNTAAQLARHVAVEAEPTIFTRYERAGGTRKTQPPARPRGGPTADRWSRRCPWWPRWCPSVAPRGARPDELPRPSRPAAATFTCPIDPQGARSTSARSSCNVSIARDLVALQGVSPRCGRSSCRSSRRAGLR